jgi:membrane-associated HD superfamily phosphohydrolase
MEKSSLISLMRRASLMANLDEETKATLQSLNTTTTGSGQRKENEKWTMEQRKQPKSDLNTNTRTIKIGYQNITITKKWTLAKIREDKDQHHHTRGTSKNPVFDENSFATELTKTAGANPKTSVAQASKIAASSPR